MNPITFTLAILTLILGGLIATGLTQYRTDRTNFLKGQDHGRITD